MKNILASLKLKRAHRLIGIALAAVLGVGIAFGVTSYAHAGNHIEKRIEHLKKIVQLTDAQAQQMRTIFDQNKEKLKADRQAVKNATDANKAAAKAQFKQDRELMQTQMMAVLTPDQQQKLQAWKAAHPHKEKDKKD